MAVPNTPYPIGNYGDLKKAVAEWADRDDSEFVDQIPNFINFAEKELYRQLRIPPMQKEAYIEINNGQAYVPTDWLTTCYLISADGYHKARETSFDEVMYRANQRISEGELVFARAGRRFFFYPEITATIPTCDRFGNYVTNGSEMIIGYYADQPELTGDEETSTLLTIAPDLLLYTALKHACSFMLDKEGESAWQEKQQASMQQLEEQNANTDFKGSPLAVHLAPVTTYW